MIEPDFREPQLQSHANIALSNFLRATFGQGFSPIIISGGHYEDLWGWDVAFHFPWLGPVNIEQQGCNFFIQYKISNCYTTSSAIGWDNWKQPFYRFDLGYRLNNQWDFTQRDHLISLSNSFSVVYISNGVLSFRELDAFFRNETLINHLPAFEVNARFMEHDRLSFIPHQVGFSLHSKPEYFKSRALSEIFKEPRKFTDIKKDLRILIDLFKESTFVGLSESSELLNLPLEKAIPITAMLLKRYFNLHWIRITRNNGEHNARSTY